MYFFSWIYFHTFEYPLRQLYRNGPELKGWGFWGGKKVYDICGELSGVTAQFWQDNPEACEELVVRHTNSFVTGATFLAYVLIICSASQYLWAYLTFTRPLKRTIESSVAEAMRSFENESEKKRV